MFSTKAKQAFNPRVVFRSLHTSTPHRSAFADSDVVILSATRTPIGSFQGALASVPAPQLGAIVIKDALKKAGIEASDVNDVILGNVVSSNLGQAPATQAASKAGIPQSVPSTTINKVCSSGLKSVMFAAQQVQTGQANVVVAGGFESMSNIPYYLPKLRSGQGLGHGEVLDGIIKDGLWDSQDNHHMGMCAEACATTFNITREQQDAFAIESYRRAQVAQKAGAFKDEITPVVIESKKGSVTVSDDEEPAKLKADKIPTLKPAFKPKDGTVTAANASKLNDGASAIIVASGAWARSKGLKPIARILGFADAQRKPIEFTIAPSDVIPKALQFAKKSLQDVDAFEINEAFSSVAIANMQLLKLDPSKVNINGGAVALGHPIGASGGRILVTLLHVLKAKNGKIGVAAICNGGGGASGVVVERL